MEYLCVLLAPMFIVGTHEAESSDDQAERQEQLIHDILTEHNYIQRVVAADQKQHKLIFRVDNTRSGSDDPDPVVAQLRQLIEKLAEDCWGNIEETPLPWAVLLRRS